MVPNMFSKLMEVRKVHVEIELIAPMLGTNPMSPDVVLTHMLRKVNENIKALSKSTSKSQEACRLKDAKEIPEEAIREEVFMAMTRLSKVTGQAYTMADVDEMMSEDKTLQEKWLSHFDDALKESSGVTVFHRWEETPAIGCWMIYGLLKDAAESVCRERGTKGSKEKKTAGTAHALFTSIEGTKSAINTQISIQPRFIKAELPEGGEMKWNTRSLRAMTAQGPRVALAKSEELPVGTKFRFTLVIQGTAMNPDNLLGLLQMSEHAKAGIGQWRNADFGKFRVTGWEVDT